MYFLHSIACMRNYNTYRQGILIFLTLERDRQREKRGHPAWDLGMGWAHRRSPAAPGSPDQHCLPIILSEPVSIPQVLWKAALPRAKLPDVPIPGLSFILVSFARALSLLLVFMKDQLLGLFFHFILILFSNLFIYVLNLFTLVSWFKWVFFYLIYCFVLQHDVSSEWIYIIFVF